MTDRPTTDTPRRSCGTCLYACKLPPSGGMAFGSSGPPVVSATVKLECRRHPPTPAPDRDRFGVWPRVRSEDWCHEWDGSTEA